jgi:hypothetical protein
VASGEVTLPAADDAAPVPIASCETACELLGGNVDTFGMGEKLGVGCELGGVNDDGCRVPATSDETTCELLGGNVDTFGMGEKLGVACGLGEGDGGVGEAFGGIKVALADGDAHIKPLFIKNSIINLKF